MGISLLTLYAYVNEFSPGGGSARPPRTVGAQPFCQTRGDGAARVRVLC